MYSLNIEREFYRSESLLVIMVINTDTPEVMNKTEPVLYVDVPICENGQFDWESLGGIISYKIN